MTRSRNVAVWESTRHFKQAFNNLEFQSQLTHYPSSATTLASAISVRPEMGNAPRRIARVGPLKA